VTCPECGGDYYEKEAILEDGSGPEYYCDFCEEGKVSLFRWLRWKVSDAWWDWRLGGKA
jgi:hypothetical protein